MSASRCIRGRSATTRKWGRCDPVSQGPIPEPSAEATEFPRLLRYLAPTIAVGMAAFHLWVVFFGVPQVMIFRSTHWLLALVLIFLWYPAFRRSDGSVPLLSRLLDLVPLAGSLAAIGYIYVEHEYIVTRFAYVDDLRTADLILGIVMIAVTLDAARRTVGWALPITAALFLAYGIFIEKITTLELIDQMYLTTDGIFGIPISVSATFMVLFVLFGAFVARSGTGKLFMDFSMALSGHTAGGPAKVACMTSALFGTVSGSSTANVMTTGTFTIPMMKRIGYKPAFAGAVEAVASTGGQIMPPIMGAAAFVMAEFMGTSYLHVIKIAAIPALLYFVAVFLAVHFEAKRTGIHGLPRSELPRAGSVLVERGHQFIPLFIIVVVLVAGFSPPYAATCGLLSVIPIGLLRRTTRSDMTLKTIYEAVVLGVRNSLPIAAACACAGIVIGIVSLTGLGVIFSQFIVALSQDTMILALVLTAIAGIILGMGLPTTPAYIVQVALLVPALMKLGVPLEAAHMFVLYFAILSVITPPVAISLFAANGLSGAGLWASGLAAMRLAATGYIIPFMFVYGPSLLMLGAWQSIAANVVTALVGVTCLAAGLNGYLLRSSTSWERLLLVTAAFVLIKPGMTTDILGFGVLGLVVLSQRLRPAAAATGR